jgi:phage terminase large subunit
MAEDKFTYTTAIRKIRAMKARKKVIQGSTSSGKTYGIIPVLIHRAAKEAGLKITVVNETIPAAKDGPVDIFKKIMQGTGRWRESGWIGNPIEYTFANGSRIQFKSFDSEGKAKASGKRDILFLNEANHIEFRIADALMIRSKETYLDYNPDNEFYAHTEILTEENSEFLLLTYKDNEALPEETLEDMLSKRTKAFHNPLIDGDGLFNEENVKSKYWANWWRVYGLGQTGRLQGLVFEDWEVVDEIPEGSVLQGYGIDFGFSKSPFAMVAVYKLDGKYYFEEVVYSTGLTNQQAADMAKEKGINPNVMAYADCAEPKSIKELQVEGINVMACDSKIDLRDNVIRKMSGDTFYVTKRSTNVIEELNHFKWATDRSGEPTNKPIKAWDHALDGVFYFIGTYDKYSGEY